MTLGKISIPLLLLGPIVGGALTAGAGWASNKAAVAVVEKRADKLEERADKTDDKQAAADVQQAELKTDIKYLTGAMRRLEEKLGTRK